MSGQNAPGEGHRRRDLAVAQEVAGKKEALRAHTYDGTMADREMIRGRGTRENHGATAARQAALASRAAQRARTSRAALLCALSVGMLSLLRMLLAGFPLTGLWLLAVRAVGTGLCVLLPALLGLFPPSGERIPLRMGALNAAQIRLFALTGALAIFPVAMSSAVTRGLFGADPAQPVQATAPQAALFLPMLLHEALFVPVCEELFFRGYLLGTLGQESSARAAVAVSAAFALAHGINAAWPGNFLLGLLLSALSLRANALSAAMLAHGFYNGLLVISSYLGLDGLIGGHAMVSCTVQLLGTTACLAAIKRALSLPPARHRARVWDGKGLSRRETLLLAGAMAALVLAVVLALCFPSSMGEAAS